MFTGKFTEKELVSTWNNIKTYFERERLRESGSKTSGAGTSKVIQSTNLNLFLAGNMYASFP